MILICRDPELLHLRDPFEIVISLDGLVELPCTDLMEHVRHGSLELELKIVQSRVFDVTSISRGAPADAQLLTSNS